MKKIILNRNNILLFLLVVTLILLMVILFRLKVTSVKEGIPRDKLPEKVIINKEDYKKNISSALAEYEQLIKDAGMDATATKQVIGSDDPIFKRIDDLKNKIVSIKAPSTEYKDLHMNLVMSLLSIKDYLEMPANKKNVACIDSIKKVKKSQELLLDQ